jgi:hypothetical protein
MRTRTRARPAYWVSAQLRGGRGAVREFCEMLLGGTLKWARAGASRSCCSWPRLAAGSWWVNQQHEQCRATAIGRPPGGTEGLYMTEAEITTGRHLTDCPSTASLPTKFARPGLRGPTDLREVRVEYNVYSPNPVAR